MLTKFIKWLWSIRAQFFRYFVTGGSGVVLDVASIFVFKEYLHMRPVIAVVFNQFIVLTYIFLLNKFWSFHADGLARRQLFRFLFVAAGNYTFAVTWMWVMTENFHVHYILARVMNIALSVCWNFLLYRFYVYADRPELVPVQPAVRDTER